MIRNANAFALCVLAIGVPGCSTSISPPVGVAPPPAPGAATGPIARLRLTFGLRFDSAAAIALHLDNFQFQPSDFCPQPRANGTSVIGSTAYVGGKLQCRPFDIYFWPNAVRGMPHWHRLVVDYRCGWRCVFALRAETKGTDFIFKPPHLVLFPAGKLLPSESVSFGTLKVSRRDRAPTVIYAERVGVQHPAPPTGISIVLSDSSPVAKGCEAGTGHGTIAYQP